MMTSPESRAQFKPEMIWQIEAGLRQEDREASLRQLGGRNIVHHRVGWSP